MNNWITQDPKNPLYPNLIWSKPENVSTLGNILLIGGNQYDFKNLATIYTSLSSLRIKNIKLVLPNILKKTLRLDSTIAEYLDSTPSGSLARKGLDNLLAFSSWADLIIIGGDLGKNAETRLLIEEFVSKNSKPLIYTQDSYFINPKANNLFVHINSLSYHQKFFNDIKSERFIKQKASLIQTIQSFHEISKTFPQALLTINENNVILSYDKKTVLTPILCPEKDILNKLVSQTAFYLAAFKDKTYPAICTAIAETCL